ncbi:CheR family methyltransferase [Deinococcus sp. QL22]|uniref:CheR family methyltransferase n=1 Tax=Deinococcus sp. QL22 TaxID=2939437 RepID=UPI002017279F|nr:CheR family methyltransferase [Deinococcus sp. QL22]UQN10079.1 PAS domain-containing protein [Deinococcus sp. QL22]
MTSPSDSPASPLWMVGIGGSAGALDGYERFFSGMPSGAGMTFLVVPHLDPHHKGVMPELLQRCTPMPVVQIKDGMITQPGHVYVVPPGKSLSLLRGQLLLDDADPSPTPIDRFFESLARDQGEQAVAVVLSGMGADGSRGLQSIHDNLGRVLVQDPISAQYPAMPENAVATGLADQVLPATELASYLYDLVHGVPMVQMGMLIDENGEIKAGATLYKILLLIRKHTGQDFSQYKKNTIVRRIERRMKGNQIMEFADYLRHLQDNKEEVVALARDLVINVTSFFRDPEAFERLTEHLRHSLINRPRNDIQSADTFRVWVVGCSTGEEAYSVAMVLCELMDEGLGGIMKIQIFASDIDEHSLDRGREGFYPLDISYTVSEERLERFFVRHTHGYKVKPSLRDMIIFTQHSTFGDPPFTRLDVLTCRNMLIYLGNDLQKQLIPLFHYALKPHGLLFLGPSETIGQVRNLFSTLETRWKIFQRNPGSSGPIHLGRGLAGLSATNMTLSVATQREHAKVRRSKGEPDLPSTVQNLLLNQWAPPAVVVDETGNIQYVSGHTGPYLELPAGQPGLSANVNVVDMARSGLRYELAAALRIAVSDQREVIHRNIRLLVGEGTLIFDLIVHPIVTAPALKNLLLIVFAAPTLPSSNLLDTMELNGPTGQLAELERELRITREHLQVTLEESEISLEQSRSANEELQTTNEELQSANEELMTSKEELQSLNEELITINSEHQMMISDLAQANDDIKNLLDSLGIATVFLDNTLRVKRFTPKITSIISLIPSDAGRPIGDIFVNLNYEHFMRDIKEVLENLTAYQTEVQTKEGIWYLMRITPYRTFDNFIDGVVIVFTNIVSLKQLERQLEESLLYAKAMINSLPDPVMVLDPQLKVHTVNRPLVELLKVPWFQLMGEALEDLADGVLDIPDLISVLRKLTLGSPAVVDFVADLNLPLQSMRKYKFNARHLVSEDGKTELILLMLEDITNIVNRALAEGSSMTDEHDAND